MAREWAKIAFERPTWGVFKPDDNTPRSTVMGDWTIAATWGEWQFGQKDWTWIKTEPAPWGNEPVGGAAIAHLSANVFLVAGDHVRLNFGARPGGPANGLILRVEEGHFRDSVWVRDRIWNGDQTDYGINLIEPVLLRVTMGAYR